MDKYIVQPGDTLYSIARLFEVPTARIRALNPEIGEGDTLFVGQTLHIPANEAIRPIIEVNAYTYPVSNPEQWSAIFPYLTYLSIFGYETLPGGRLASLNAEPLVAAARQAGVAPLMAVTNTVQGVYSGRLLHDILSDDMAQQALIENSVAFAQAHGYYGVNFGFEQILPEDYAAYASFLERAANRLHTLGLIIVISIPLLTVLNNILYLAQPLSLYGRVLDRLIVAVGDFLCGEEQIPIDSVQKGLDDVTRYVSSPKILLGIPNCCYGWAGTPPDGGAYYALTADQADALVRRAGAVPETDPNTQRTIFRIQEEGNPPFMVICDPVRSLNAMELVRIYNLGGISFRSLNLFSFASYQAISVRNEIRKASALGGGSNG